MAYLSFTAHPASVGETYLEHLRHAGGFGASMVKAGLALFANGLFPFLFARTGPSIIVSLYDSMDANPKRIGNQGGAAPSSTHDEEPSQQIDVRQARSKAVAWWIEFANGRHSSPYPSEAEARAVVATAGSSDAVLQESPPLWLVSSEGLRVAIASSGPCGRLRPIEVGLAAFLAVVVGSAIYCVEHATPAFHPEAPAPLARATAARLPHAFAIAALPPRSANSPQARYGGRDSGLEMLVTRILNTQNEDQKLRAGTTRRTSVVLRRP